MDRLSRIHNGQEDEMSNTPAEAAIQAVKAQEQNADIHVLSTGVRVRIRAVPQLLIDDAVNKLDEPRVPTVMDEDKGYAVENPSDPNYLLDIQKYEREQTQAAVAVALMWGLELVDGMPEDASWLEKTRWLSKHGYLNLSKFDLDDKLDVEFLYKRHVAVRTEDLDTLMAKMISGVTQEDIDKAKESFRSPKK